MAKKLLIAFNPTAIELIDQIVSDRMYETRSAFIREAVRDKIEKMRRDSAQISVAKLADALKTD